MEKIIKYLGLDWGEKRIGLATADNEVNMALPLKTVASLAEVLVIILEEEIDIIIVGSPQKMNGTVADNQIWRHFIDELAERSGRRIELVDERLSSLAADALFGEDYDKAGRDEIAATIILQSYLDRELYGGK